jgi:hypothetical protein
MSKIGIKAAGKAAQPRPGHAPSEPTALSEEDRSKDFFFGQVAAIAEAMIARHGRDFAMGTLVLSAKFIAEGKPLSNRTDGGDDNNSAVKSV